MVILCALLYGWVGVLPSPGLKLQCKVKHCPISTVVPICYAGQLTHSGLYIELTRIIHTALDVMDSIRCEREVRG